MRRYWKDLVWIVSIASAIIAISIIWYDYINVIFEKGTKHSCVKPYLNLSISFTFTLILVIYAIVASFIWKRRFRSTAIMILPIMVSLLIFTSIFWHLYRGFAIGKHFFIDPGGLFTIIIGIATVIGVYLAIKDIDSLKYKEITSYPQFMENLINLINDSSGEIRFVSYFVLPGYFQVRKEQGDRLKNEIYSARDRVKIVCINTIEHLSFLIDISIKGTNKFPPVPTTNITLAAQRIEEMQRITEHELLSHFNHKPARLSWHEMPNYYFFVTNERAIIVTPVGLPKLNAKINKGMRNSIVSKMNDKKNVIKSLESLINKTLTDGSIKKESAKIDTLGFETTDQNIIDMLWKEFDKYYIKDDNRKISKE